MSKILGYSGSDNQYTNFPPKMSDGRNFSKAQQPIELDEIIQSSTNNNNNWNYRHYLINNADSIIELNQRYACGNNNINFEKGNNTEGSFIFAQPFTENTKFTPNNLKANYLTREDLESRLFAPHYPMPLTQNVILSMPRSN